MNMVLLVCLSLVCEHGVVGVHGGSIGAAGESFCFFGSVGWWWCLSLLCEHGDCRFRSVSAELLQPDVVQIICGQSNRNVRGP